MKISTALDAKSWKHHFYRRFGLWHCSRDGITGIGYTTALAFDDWLQHYQYREMA